MKRKDSIVYLANPNGIFVGEGAAIDVGSFHLSIADISDSVDNFTTAQTALSLRPESRQQSRQQRTYLLGRCQGRTPKAKPPVTKASWGTWNCVTTR